MSGPGDWEWDCANPINGPHPPEPSLGTNWCPTCRRRRPVADRFEDSIYQPSGEHEFIVTVMDCGHSTSTTPAWARSAPGAPYAGRPGSAAAGSP